MIKKILLFLTLTLTPISVKNNGIEYIESKISYQSGIASFYANKFINKKTANGEIYTHYELTAAHKNLPFNTIVKVTNMTNNKSVFVRINDRLPQSSKRVIDLSRSAANRLNMIKRGLVKVNLEIYI